MNNGPVLVWELDEEKSSWTSEMKTLVEDQIMHDLNSVLQNGMFNVEVRFQDSYLDEDGEQISASMVFVDVEGIPPEDIYDKIDESLEKLKYPENSKQEPIPILTDADYA